MLAVIEKPFNRTKKRQGRARATESSKVSTTYQDKPNGDKQCSNCAQFVPNNRCKIVEGTISPKGYCIVWQKKS
jgi:hypothetical protein